MCAIIRTSPTCIDRSALVQVNFLIIESLKRYHYFYGNEFKVRMFCCVGRVFLREFEKGGEKHICSSFRGLFRLPYRRARTT
jgi:hypothetical protein